ncbi:DUF1080 domain-containing protein [Niabella terrae]
MLRKIFIAAVVVLLTNIVSAAAPADLIGRWDITVTRKGEEKPSWLEVKLSGYKTLVGYFVSETGSARPVAEVKFDNGKFSFAIPPQWETEPANLQLDGQLNNDGISGTITYPDGEKCSFTGVKAPLLKREKAPVWGSPIKLFNGKDLSGWKAMGANSQWVVKDGILTSPQSGVNLVSERTFKDFKLHIEFRYQKGSNSGVYLRGRYETQILDNDKSEHPSNVNFSGIYGFLTPSEVHSKGPGEWQTYDITLIGRMVTIVANGKTVISNQEIPGITGGALDSHEGNPGPLYLQGDHGPIEFKNIIITPAK